MITSVRATKLSITAAPNAAKIRNNTGPGPRYNKKPQTTNETSAAMGNEPSTIDQGMMPGKPKPMSATNSAGANGSSSSDAKNESDQRKGDTGGIFMALTFAITGSEKWRDEGAPLFTARVDVGVSPHR